MYWDQVTGVLRPGMQADLVVIDKDLKAIAPEEIRGATVTATVVAGKVVYSK
jgi:predicted amidohydrolase YtcJ